MIKICDIKKLNLKVQKCNSQKQEIGIRWKGETIWLCKKCWNKIADTDFECGEDKKKSWKQMQREERKIIKSAIPTEYLPNGKPKKTKRKRRKKK